LGVDWPVVCGGWLGVGGTDGVGLTVGLGEGLFVAGGTGGAESGTPARATALVAITATAATLARPATRRVRRVRRRPRSRTCPAGSQFRFSVLPYSSAKSGSGMTDLLRKRGVKKDGEGFSPTGETGFDGARRRTCLLGDVQDGQIRQVVQDNRLPLLGWQPSQRRDQRHGVL